VSCGIVASPNLGLLVMKSALLSDSFGFLLPWHSSSNINCTLKTGDCVVAVALAFPFNFGGIYLRINLEKLLRTVIGQCHQTTVRICEILSSNIGITFQTRRFYWNVALFSRDPELCYSVCLILFCSLGMVSPCCVKPSDALTNRLVQLISQ